MIGSQNIRKIILGNISQNNDIFGNLKNTQCTSNSVMALCFSKVINVNNWDAADIDKILHVKSLDKQYDAIPDGTLYLCADEVCLDAIIINDRRINCTADITNFELQGLINVNFRQVIHNFFEMYGYGVFTCRLKSIALIKNNAEYWLFDPHSCNHQAFYYDGGVAVACRFNNIHNLIIFIKENFTGNNNNDNSPFVFVPFLLSEFNENQLQSVVDIASDQIEISINDK